MDPEVETTNLMFAVLPIAKVTSETLEAPEDTVYGPPALRLSA